MGWYFSQEPAAVEPCINMILQSNDLEHAVQLFADVRQIRTAHYGGMSALTCWHQQLLVFFFVTGVVLSPLPFPVMAPECASAYYRYGSALFYQAQDSADVFGGPIGGNDGNIEDDKENEVADREETEAEPLPSEVTVTNVDAKGKGPASDAAAVSVAEQADVDDASGIEEGDMQLAWENLETARSIWFKDPVANRSELASVHVLLGDVSMEKEDFEECLAEYETSLEYYAELDTVREDRRVAEVHFKRSCALQFLGRPDEALTAVKLAVEVLHRKKATLLRTDGEEAKATLTDVEAVLEELNEKVEELTAAAMEQSAMRTAVRGAMEQISAAMVGVGKVSGVGSVGQEPSSHPAGPSPVKDLGIVGRGTKRINLASVGGQTTDGSVSVGPEGEVGEVPVPKKRSLEDMMSGPSNGDTTVGFGKEEKAQGNGDQETAVPAFLMAYRKDKTAQTDGHHAANP